MIFEEYPLHDSIRGWFGRALYFEMQKNPNILLFTSDLGYGLWDLVRRDMPDQFVNFGASECCMIGAAVGATLSGRVVFCYSITTFLIYRPFEWIRNYIEKERIPVRLIGSGYDDDYKHDGITHQPWGVYDLIEHEFPQLWLASYWPKEKEQIPKIVETMVGNNEPSFICLRR